MTETSVKLKLEEKKGT